MQVLLDTSVASFFYLSEIVQSSAKTGVT